MISLFIDTSNFRLVVAVIDENKSKILSYYNESLKNDLSEKIFGVIDECINKANVKAKNIEKIYSVVGPGSFTGVRIGVTISKTFAWALKKIVIPISSLEVLASTKVNTKYVVPMIDARRRNVYAGIYDNNVNLVKPDTHISLGELEKITNNKEYTFVSDDDIIYFEKVESNIDLLKIVNKHKDDQGIDPHHLNPCYLKLTEAEENLKNNDNRD